MEMMMCDCEVLEAWSLPLFLGAPLNLAAAFLLFRVLASTCCSLKFLPSFGLRLQCPYHGLDGRCVWRDTSKSSDKTVVWPFCSQKGEGPTGDVNGGGSGARLDALKSARPAVRGKGLFNLRLRFCLGRRLEGLARCNDLSCSSCDVQIAEGREVCSPSSLERSCSNRAESLTSPSRFSLGPDDVLAVEEGSRCNFMKAVGGLESELMKGAGCVGCASSCLELDKERNAAPTATDNVIAMIVQLQREKASTEMEAKQHWRVTREKSAFDAAEMNIQKWAVSSSKGDDVESMQTAGGNDDSNQDVKEKGSSLITDEPLSSCRGLSLEIEEPFVPTESLGERNMDGTPADVFSDKTMDAHSDTFDISLHSSSSTLPSRSDGSIKLPEGSTGGEDRR